MGYPEHLEIVHRLSDGTKKFLVNLAEALRCGPDQKLDTIIDLLRRQSGVPAELGLLRERAELIHGLAYENSQVLTTINDFNRKVDSFMASQEERLRTIQGQLGGVASGIDTLQQQIADLKANNPELEDELTGIESTVKAMADDLNPPAPDSGDTGAGSGDGGVVTGDTPTEGGGSR